MLLANDPTGYQARMQPETVKITIDDALTTWEREFRRLQRQATIGFRTAGVGCLPDDVP
jgi:hypothetical protein